jgi:anti-sigma regulatory factor (Ser/Thr protein kinase)
MRSSGEHDSASLAQSELLLPARRAELAVARKYAADFAEAFGLEPDDSYDFVLAVNEAVTNAVRHGASDDRGMIHLSIVADAERLTFAVRDSGTFAMPVMDGPVNSDGGRGLALMASLVDEVQLEIDPGGTTVRLSKVRP